MTKIGKKEIKTGLKLFSNTGLKLFSNTSETDHESSPNTHGTRFKV